MSTIVVRLSKLYLAHQIYTTALRPHARTYDSMLPTTLEYPLGRVVYIWWTSWVLPPGPNRLIVASYNHILKRLLSATLLGQKVD